MGTSDLLLGLSSCPDPQFLSNPVDVEHSVNGRVPNSTFVDYIRRAAGLFRATQLKQIVNIFKNCVKSLQAKRMRLEK